MDHLSFVLASEARSCERVSLLPKTTWSRSHRGFSRSREIKTRYGSRNGTIQCASARFLHLESTAFSRAIDEHVEMTERNREFVVRDA